MGERAFGTFERKRLADTHFRISKLRTMVCTWRDLTNASTLTTVGSRDAYVERAHTLDWLPGSLSASLSWRHGRLERHRKCMPLMPIVSLMRLEGSAGPRTRGIPPRVVWRVPFNQLQILGIFMESIYSTWLIHRLSNRECSSGKSMEFTVFGVMFYVHGAHAGRACIFSFPYRFAWAHSYIGVPFVIRRRYCDHCLFSEDRQRDASAIHHRYLSARNSDGWHGYIFLYRNREYATSCRYVHRVSRAVSARMHLPENG